ncbi:IQ motif and SEC7 domain-containing protein 1-like isoform X1 [Stylophora pistillata]|uniref:IQ motif and SEC7 domain-containing protein 1-like isoform X1 n=1 Tax=Stylophora pistillata TaxID=50429 RepID=UPI000C043972|nr:IQ motif and SEC7 domain-containing protein 1-like isoform X1 [Stylophora pistillata]
MSSVKSTLEALTSVDSLVDTLKACIWKQDKIIREKNEEIENLRSRVKELEKERNQLRHYIARGREDSLTNVNTGAKNIPDGENRAVDSGKISQDTPERNSSTGGSSDVFTTPQTPTSPMITITAAETPQNSPKLVKRDTFKAVKRNDSLNRQKSFSKKYELSPELQDRSVKVLERQYGGKDKAHWAARVIQSYYRKYRMDKQFRRMRAYSGSPLKDPFRPKSNSDPQSQITSPRMENSSEAQVTPVLRITKRKSGSQRVKSILIIDNINSLTGEEPQMYSSEIALNSSRDNFPTDLTSIFTGAGNRVDAKLIEQKEALDEKVGMRKESITSETEHYVKVEVVDNVETLPDDAFVKDGLVPNKVPNGDLPGRPRRETLTDDGSTYGSDDSGDEMRRDLSSVDSLDGICAPSLTSTDDDTSSLYSEFDSGTKPQKLETRIGINHFNRKPEKGINYLVAHQVLEDSPEVVAKFLLSESGISKQKLGEYLGNLQNEFNMEVLKYFVQSMDFTGMEVDEALRVYQTSFRLPGEAQKIEKLMLEFASRYVSCNPVDEKGALDTILILAFAIVMLNTDLHSPNVKRRMTEADFINNLRGTNNGGDFPEESLLEIYNRVKKKAFSPGKDHVNVVEKLGKKIVGTRSPWTTLAALHRQLRLLTPLYNVRDPNKKEKAHPRVIFLFNDMLVATKERGRAGRGEGIHYYSYKLSFSLCGVKVSTFSRDYYPFGIQIYSKLDSRVLAYFNARDEETRKVFVDELVDCIEETNEMESDRITTEKQKHLGNRFNRSGVDMNRASLTLPKKLKQPSPDTISLIDSASSMESLGTGLMGSKQLSSSLLNINENGEFSELKKSSSISSLDSAFTEAGSDQTMSDDLQGSHSTLNRKGLFGKWRSRYNSKSVGRPSPNMTPVSSPARNCSTPR